MKIHDPKSVGFDPHRLKRIDVLMQRYVDAGTLPGFVTLVARHGKIAYLNTCGLMDRESNRPYQPDTIVRIYSMTKPITSVALLMLYEQGFFNLLDPISAVLPEFAEMQVYEDGELVSARTPITFQHLLTHTAGLSYGDYGGRNSSEVDKFYDEVNPFDMGRSLEENIKALAQLPLRFHPGTQWHYSIATDVIGRLVEVISGQSLGRFIDEQICQPLEMVDTAFHIDPAKVDRFATLYQVTPDNPLALFDLPDTSDYLPPVDTHFGGQGLVSTIHDYYRFATCLLNKGTLEGTRILGRKTVERMRMNHLSSALLPIAFEFSEPFYGMGFGLGVNSMIDVTQSGLMGSNGDHGWGGYAETVFWIDPEEDLIAINLTQCMPSSYYPIRKEFRTAVYQALVD
ncbi:MAG: serine hydrolase domain-containing protein [Chloroflexota bacterium]